MNCENCTKLQAEINALKAERQAEYLQNTHEYMLLAKKLKLSLNEAWIIHALWRAAGQPVSSEELLASRPARNKISSGARSIYYKERSMAYVYVHKIRSKLGVDVIKTYARGAYVLTSDGADIVSRALQTQAVA